MFAYLTAAQFRATRILHSGRDTYWSLHCAQVQAWCAWEVFWQHINQFQEWLWISCWGKFACKNAGIRPLHKKYFNMLSAIQVRRKCRLTTRWPNSANQTSLIHWIYLQNLKVARKQVSMAVSLLLLMVWRMIKWMIIQIIQSHSILNHRIHSLWPFLNMFRDHNNEKT